MTTWLWAIVLLPAVWAAHWGAEHLAAPLKKLRRRWGFSEAAGAAFVGLAAASPEIGINTTSALRGVAEIGLGASLGSNVLAIPLVVAVAYVATRSANFGGGEGEPETTEQGGQHTVHRRDGLLRIKRQAVWVQAVPYLLLVGVFALLVLPRQWRGLQRWDGLILLGCYLAYLAQALLRGRADGAEQRWTSKEVALAAAGLAALAVGAYFTVRSTEQMVAALGIGRTVGGMFITAPMAALPELFAVWSVTRSGQVTAAASSVMGDHAVTMTVAFLPLALIELSVGDVRLLWVNLAFVTLMPTLYAAFVHWGHPSHGFKLWQVLALVGTYAAYVAVVLAWVLNR